MRGVPIYAKKLKEYCSKKTGKRSMDLLTVHVMGKLFDIMLGKFMAVKYGDPGNPILTMQINGVEIPNVLVDVPIYVITSEIMHMLGLRNLEGTPTILELADRSIVNPVGNLEDIKISVDS